MTVRQTLRLGLSAALAMVAGTASGADMGQTPSFDVAVSLSPAAIERLAQGHETIIVAVDVFGMAIAHSHHHPDQVGQIDLGSGQRVELGGAGLAHFRPVAYQTDLLNDVQDRKLIVLVNVFSGRHSSPDNLLDCGIFEDDVRLAARAPVRIDCKLIGEQ
jgi:hypothetical protein